MKQVYMRATELIFELPTSVFNFHIIKDSLRPQLWSKINVFKPKMLKIVVFQNSWTVMLLRMKGIHFLYFYQKLVFGKKN